MGRNVTAGRGPHVRPENLSLLREDDPLAAYRIHDLDGHEALPVWDYNGCYSRVT
jgi:hypothetical protein